MNLLFFRLICLHSAPGKRIYYRHPSSLAVIRREIRRGDKQKEDVGGRSRVQCGAGAACIVAFPPLSTRPTYQIGWGRHSRQSPPPPIFNYCSFQRLRRIFATASRWRSRVEKLILDSYSEHPLLLPFFDRTPRSIDIGENLWNFGGHEFFCWRQYFVTFWHGGPVQPGRDSAGASRPAGCSQLLSDYTRRRQLLQRRTLARWERTQLLWTLPGQNSKKILHWTCI